MKLAINGLGRIGRLVLRQLMDIPDLEITAVNDVMDTRTLAHLLKHDSVHGRAGFDVARDDKTLILNGKRIPAFQEQDPTRLPFGNLGTHLVLECSGRFTDRGKAALHLKGSVRHVIVSETVEDADLVIVMGLNQDRFDADAHRILSCGSSALQGLAPMVKVLDEHFGIEFGLFTIVQSYTNDQRILDQPHRDLRLARAASISMIPTDTDAARMIGLVIPHLANKLDGIAVHVPTPDMNLTDLSVVLARDATRESIHEAFLLASRQGPLKGLLEILEEELVSVDLIGCSASCLLDPFLTKIMTPRFVKVFGWHDNEFGYAARLKDLALHVLRQHQTTPSHSPSR